MVNAPHNKYQQSSSYLIIHLRISTATKLNHTNITFDDFHTTSAESMYGIHRV